MGPISPYDVVPQDHSLSPTQIQSFFERIGRLLFFTRYTDSTAFRLMLRRGNFSGANSVLEIGAGYGCLAEIALQEFMNKSAKCMLVDVSEILVERLRCRLSSYGDRVTTQVVALNPPYTFAGATFDRIMSSYVLDVINRAQAQNIVDEAYRLLTDDGLLCLLLTDRGRTPFSRFVMGIHALIFAIDPRLVAISRPIEVASLMPDRDWVIQSVDYVHVFGLSSQIVIAKKKLSTRIPPPT